MKVLIRADASFELGTGHVMRCLTLADTLREAGAEVRFAARDCPGNLLSLLQQRGHGVEALATLTEEDDARATRAIAERCAPDWLVVDHYGLGLAWETALRQVAPELLAIDDLDRAHDCSLLLDQNGFGARTSERYRQNRASRRLLGPRYGLLRPEYAVLRTVLPPRSGDIGRVLVFFGGSDTDNETARVLEALSAPEFGRLQVDVVVGVNHPDPAGIAAQVRARPGTALHRNLPTLAGLMARADLAIGAGGATAWERVALGLPAIVSIVADNQAEPSRALHDAGAQMVLGDLVHRPDVAAWRGAVAELLAAPERVRAMSLAAATFTDGLGARRVARAMLGGRNLGLRLRPASLADEALLLEWANDPAARANSFNRQSIAAAEHADWLRRRLADAATLILIGEDRSGLPLGQVRIEAAPDGTEAVVSLSLDVAVRGLGLGTVLLEQAMAAWAQQGAATRLVAETLGANTASARLFLRCGFTECAPRRPGARCFVHECQVGEADGTQA